MIEMGEAMREKIMHAILVEPGHEPVMIELPANEGQDDKIRDILGGNYGAVEFFSIEDGISLFILVNDLAAVLGLSANRRFPPPDEKTVIYGSALFVAAYNGSTELEGTLDMSPVLCQMFIEQIKRNFPMCDESVKPSPEETIYYDGPDGSKPYRWIETDCPKNPGEPVAAGRVSFYQHGRLMEAQGRFFKKIEVYTKDTPVN